MADFPCFLTPECTTATLMTNVIALNPDKPGAPVRFCKGCAVTSLIKRNVPFVKGCLQGDNGYCEWHLTV
jgi:hypothetical protein